MGRIKPVIIESLVSENVDRDQLVELLTQPLSILYIFNQLIKLIHYPNLVWLEDIKRQQ